MSEFERVIAAIRALPNEGEGMTVDEIAEAVQTDNATVIDATAEIVEIDERDPGPEVRGE